MEQRGSSPSETFGRWKSQRRFHRKTTKAIGNLGSSQGSRAESVFGPAAEGEREMTGPRPAGRPWTPADDAQLLSSLESKMDIALIARKLQRSVQAIANRKSHLKGRLVEGRPEGEEMSPSPKITGPRWTQADDNQLRTLAAAGASCSIIAELFKRSQTSIRRRARMLKIKLAHSRPGPKTKNTPRLAKGK